MGSKVHARVNFQNDFKGTGVNDAGYEIEIGPQGATPYDLLSMALASCLYATFIEIIKKKRIEFSQAEVEVSGEKREETPTFLKNCTVAVTVSGTNRDDRPAIEKSFELATKYCSIYQTLSKVAQMEWEIDFQ